MRFDEIVDEVYQLIVKNEEEAPDFDISGFKRWEVVRENVYAKFINAEQNKELLEKIPHRNFMDLAVVYYAVARDHAQKDIGTILIYTGHMEMWGQEEKNLYQTAMMNMRTDGEADLVSIENIIRSVLPDEDISLGLGGHRRDISMYILTNSRKRFGAAEILDKKTLRMIADEVGDGFIVLPSSVHETFFIPVNEVERMKGNGLLEIIAAYRTVADLDELLKRDKYYQNALEEERSASDIMDSLNFTSEQKKAVDRVITAYNECGAAYGAVAYRFGMEDGIRVRMEMEEIMRFLKY